LEINFPPLRGLYMRSLHSWGPSDALAIIISIITNFTLIYDIMYYQVTQSKLKVFKSY